MTLKRSRQSPEVLCKKKVVLKNFTKFTGMHLSQSLFFDRVAGLRPKKTLWHRYFPVNFAKFLRTYFLQNTSGDCFWLKLCQLIEY